MSQHLNGMPGHGHLRYGGYIRANNVLVALERSMLTREEVLEFIDHEVVNLMLDDMKDWTGQEKIGALRRLMCVKGTDFQDWEGIPRLY